MRGTVAAVAVSALLVVGCDARTGSPSAAGAQASPSPAASSDAVASTSPPARTSRHDRRASDGIRVAKATKAPKTLAATGKKVGSPDAADPAGAPALSLRQSPPSSY